MDSSEKSARDLLWDETARIWYCGKVMKPHMKAVGRIVQDFIDLEATPQEIRSRLRAYKDAWPGIECSARALIVHWCRFAPKREAKFDGAIRYDVQGVQEPVPVSDIIGKIKRTA